jgi:hypothetical protein
VHARDDLDLGVERTDVGQATAVDADAVGEDAAADDVLGHRLVGGRDLGVRRAGKLAGLDLGGDLGLDAVLQCVIGVLALLLVGDLVDALELFQSRVAHDGEDLVGVRGEHRELERSARRRSGHLGLRGDELLDERLRSLEAAGDDLLVGLDGAAADEVPRTLRGLGLDHHDRDVAVVEHAARDHEVEDGLVDLLGVRERDPLVVVLSHAGDEREAHAGDGAREGQARDLRRRRGGVDREGVVELARRDREHGDDDLNLVAEAVHERRAQRAVDEAADEDGLGRRAPLTAEERAGDLARGVRALLDVDRQREEVEALAGVLARARGGEKHGLFVEVGGDGSLSLLREAAGLETDGAGAEAAIVENGLGCGDFWTLQGIPPSIRACPT